jgi:hypothetical protein
MLPGRLQEMPGDRHPSEMIMTFNREQNSAYSPLLFLTTDSRCKQPHFLQFFRISLRQCFPQPLP